MKKCLHLHLLMFVDCHHAEKARAVDRGCDWNGTATRSESQGYFNLRLSSHISYFIFNSFFSVDSIVILLMKKIKVCSCIYRFVVLKGFWNTFTLKLKEYDHLGSHQRNTV